jgi:hypothetical protein
MMCWTPEESYKHLLPLLIAADQELPAPMRAPGLSQKSDHVVDLPFLRPASYENAAEPPLGAPAARSLSRRRRAVANQTNRVGGDKLKASCHSEQISQQRCGIGRWGASASD